MMRPFIDYDAPPSWLNTPVDPLDDEGNVHISPDPGLGYDINWDYINSHKVDERSAPITMGQASPLPPTGPPSAQPRSTRRRPAYWPS